MYEKYVVHYENVETHSGPEWFLPVRVPTKFNLNKDVRNFRQSLKSTSILRLGISFARVPELE